MKGFLRALTASVLALLARGILAKYQPSVVMITGSVGKTSTKDAVAAALSPRFHLRASEKSYNSEFGVPLTIIGSSNPWTDPAAWLRVIGEGLALLVLPNHYPRLLVLEVGADRPGDLWNILKIASPSAVVVTRLPDIPVHVEAYASAEAVRQEEFAPAYALPEHAPLVVGSEDAHALELASGLSVLLRAFGEGEEADVRIMSVRPYLEAGTLAGMEALFTIDGEEHSYIVRNAFGYAQAYAPAAALALARALGLSASEALSGLASYAPPPGRARILRGMRATTLIDDSYNASPAAVESLLVSLRDAPGPRRVAVLGDMLELGRYSAEEHARVGTLAAEHAQVVVAVGERSVSLAEAARQTGRADVHHFSTSAEAAAALPELVRPGDVIAVKGSQSVRTERIVKALLEDPQDAARLVRQELQWLKR